MSNSTVQLSSARRLCWTIRQLLLCKYVSNIRFQFHFSNKGRAFYQLSVDLNRFFGNNISILRETFVYCSFIVIIVNRFQYCVRFFWPYLISIVILNLLKRSGLLIPRKSSDIWYRMADGISCNNSNNFKFIG